MKILSLLARKGGAGKTTLAVNLAVAAVRAGRRVLLVDTDPQASATDWRQSRASETPGLVTCTAAKLAAVLPPARAFGVDLVVVDSRPSAEADTASIAGLSDFVLIPTRPTLLDMRAIAVTVDTVVAARRPAAIVLNAVPAVREGEEVAQTTEARKMLAAYAVAMSPVTVGHRVAFAHAMQDGRGVSEFEPGGKAAAEVETLYRFVEAALWSARGRSL
jgi:chromosome partitioning protein